MNETISSNISDSPQLRERFSEFALNVLKIQQDLQEPFNKVYLPLAMLIDEKITPGKMATVGICGGQGSGKSTLAAILKFILENHGKKVAAFSVDDLYLPWEARKAIIEKAEKEKDPYYQVSRGNPGTHDTDLGCRIINSLCNASPEDVTKIPVFDKALHGGKGDRLPEDKWVTYKGRPDVLIFEGWFVGSPLLPEKSFRPLYEKFRAHVDQNPTLHAFEEKLDSDGRLAYRVNERLKDYEKLFTLFDFFTYLKVPGLAQVIEFRTRQAMRENQGMTAADVAEFVKPYYLVTWIHGLNWLADCANGFTDAVIPLDEKQKPIELIDCRKVRGD